jgi:DNA mismatch repair protein MLH1
LYTGSIAKELIAVTVRGLDQADAPDDQASGKRKSKKSRQDPDADWTADVHFTSANYQAKKLVFILFINRNQSLFHSFAQSEFLMRRSTGRISSP